MTRMAVAGCMALATLSAVTVPDVGAPTAHAATSVSPFAGSWSGTWAIEDGPFGTLDWTISDAGGISGTIWSIPGNHGGAMVGHVGAGGKLMFIGNVPGDTPNEDGNGFAFKGTALIAGDGKLVASAALAAAPFGWPIVAIFERN